MCTARDKAARFNVEYKELIKEVKEKNKDYSEERMQGIMKGLLEKTVLLAYEQDLDAKTSEENYSRFYPSGMEEGMASDDNIILGAINGGNTEFLTVRESYIAEGCKVKRHFPIITAFLLMNGQALLDNEAFKIAQASAYWIFGLHHNTDSNDIEQKMKEGGIWITDILTDKEQREFDQKSEVPKPIFDKYYEILKNFFPRYIEEREKELENEYQLLIKQNVKKGLTMEAPKGEVSKTEASEEKAKETEMQKGGED